MTEARPQILIVEDDTRIADLVAELLARGGYDTTIEARGDTALRRIKAQAPDLVLLDIGLPGLDGLEVCRQARAAGYQGPVIMLTARGEPIDEVIGLEIGADDYIAKPMNPRVLLARVKARLRHAPPSTSKPPETLALGTLHIDTGRREVTVEGRHITLTTHEFDLLAYLADRAGTVVERAMVYRDLRGIEYDGVDRSVDLRIAKLRRLIGDDPANPRWIKTVRGVGYLMMAPR